MVYFTVVRCRIYGTHSARERKGKDFYLFKDTLDTLNFWLYGVRHMVKVHSDSKKGNPLPPQRLFFPISSKGNSSMGARKETCCHHYMGSALISSKGSFI